MAVIIRQAVSVAWLLVASLISIIPYIVDAQFWDYPFLYSLGVIPFILVKKRVNEAVSEKCRRTAISAIGGEVCCNR